jgi:hypothetical protein
MSTTTTDVRPGWTTFAAMVMFAVGGFRIISAIAFFADSSRVADLSGGLFGDNLFAWGIVDLVVAALALLGGYYLLQGRGFGRAIGALWAMLALVQSFAYIDLAPWLGAAGIALAVLVMYAICVPSGADTGYWTDN